MAMERFRKTIVGIENAFTPLLLILITLILCIAIIARCSASQAYGLPRTTFVTSCCGFPLRVP